MFQSLLIWGTYIWGVLLFEWVLIFEKLVASVSMGTYICGVLVFDAPENTICTCIQLACTHPFILILVSSHTPIVLDNNNLILY